MKVLIFGATGMVGQGVFLECIRNSDVELVVTVGRTPAGEPVAELLRLLGLPDSKLREIVHPNLADLSAIETELAGFDACFFTLGPVLYATTPLLGRLGNVPLFNGDADASCGADAGGSCCAKDNSAQPVQGAAKACCA